MKNSSNLANELVDKPRSFTPEVSAFSSDKNPLNFSEVKDIQNDLVALKDDIAKLSKHVYKDGGTEIKKYAEQKLEAVENQMKNKPAQTLALVFLSGVAASFLLGRR